MKFFREYSFPIDRQLPGSRLQAMKEILRKSERSQHVLGTGRIDRSCGVADFGRTPRPEKQALKGELR